MFNIKKDGNESGELRRGHERYTRPTIAAVSDKGLYVGCWLVRKAREAHNGVPCARDRISARKLIIKRSIDGPQQRLSCSSDLQFLDESSHCVTYTLTYVHMNKLQLYRIEANASTNESHISQMITGMII